MSTPKAGYVKYPPPGGAISQVLGKTGTDDWEMDWISVATGGGGSVTFSAGAASAALDNVVFSNSNGVSFGLNGSTITGSHNGLTSQSNQAFSAAGGSSAFQTLSFSNANGISFSNNAGQLQASYNSTQFAGSGFTSTSITGTDIKATHNSQGLSMEVPNFLTTAMASNRSTDFVQATAAFAGTNASGTIASGGISVSVSAPGGNTLSQFMPYIWITGTGASSNAPASWYFNAFSLPAHVSAKYADFAMSMNAAVPGATSQNSTGTARYSYSMGFTLFTRQDFGANSNKISYLTTASFGLTAGVSYSSTSQSFVMSWVTDTTGGTSSFNTTSNNANWSNWITGLKQFRVPFATVLAPGEYFIAHAHSSTTGTTNSNVTLLSISYAELTTVGGQFTYRGIGSSVSEADKMLMHQGFGFGQGVAAAVTTNNTMNLNQLTATAGRQIIPFQLIAI